MKRRYWLGTIVLLAASLGIWLYAQWGISDEAIKTGFWKIGETDCREDETGLPPDAFRFTDGFVVFDQRTTLRDNVIYHDGQPQAVIVKRDFRGGLLADPMIQVMNLDNRKICTYYYKGSRA